jgi:hypothetical protein
MTAVTLTVIGCGNPPGTYVDESMDVPPGLEWSRQIVSHLGGRIDFKVESEGPFSVTLLTDRGYQAAKKRDKDAASPEDLLFTIDSSGESVEQTVTLPEGSSWFVILNRAEQTTRVSLQSSSSETIRTPEAVPSE